MHLMQFNLIQLQIFEQSINNLLFSSFIFHVTFAGWPQSTDATRPNIIFSLYFSMCGQLQHPMVVHVYHPYRQPDGINHCQAVNGHCSHLCLPAPRINERSPRISCACPTGLKLMEDRLMCVEDCKYPYA